LTKKLVYLICRPKKAEGGAQYGLKPNRNEILKPKTTKNLQILENLKNLINLP
jgi:hypothetical protein